MAQSTSRTDQHYAELVAALARGDERAMERLLAEAQALAYRFSVTVCGNVPDAEDAMQDALLQTYRRAKLIREPGAFRTWLYRTVKNACLMSRRPHAHEPVHMLALDDDASAIAAAEPTPEDLASAAADRRQIVEALRALPRHYRVVVFLRDLEGLSTAEVARVVGTSEDNVKQRLRRARARLKAHLQSTGAVQRPTPVRGRRPRREPSR